jgi:hypothetical protein
VFRLLIIEPFDDLRELLVEVCEASGLVEVRSFAEIAEAQTTERWSPVAVLVATSLLGDDGIPVRDVRALLPTLRYVVGMTSEPYGTGDLDCNRVVVKPFNPVPLLRHIEQHLGDQGC